MTTLERQQIAEKLGITKNIGKKIKAVHDCAFRSGDTAEIIGWGIDNRPVYYIRFDNGECDCIPAVKFFESEEYVLI